MTRERAKELLPVIQAYAEGKAIQVKGVHGDNNAWQDDASEGVYFENMGCAYRVKPEPRVWWAIIYKDDCKLDCKGRLYEPGGFPEPKVPTSEIIKVQEVL